MLFLTFPINTARIELFSEKTSVADSNTGQQGPEAGIPSTVLCYPLPLPPQVNAGGWLSAALTNTVIEFYLLFGNQMLIFESFDDNFVPN